jgi:two-component system response regulator RegX3
MWDTVRYNCLIVDDEEALSQSTCEYFAMFDVSCAWVPSAQACLDFFAEHEADLILLDINLRDGSGFALCKRLRQRFTVPILFISARGGDDDVLMALNIGGDDYIQKPYSLGVLLAKVKAVLKRCAADARCGDGGLVRLGHNTIDLRAGRAFRDGVDLNLKTMEFKLLAYLVRNQGRVVPKTELFTQVWGDAIVGDGTLNVHIRHLREKLEDDPREPRLIKTVWGTGYFLEAFEER